MFTHRKYQYPLLGFSSHIRHLRFYPVTVKSVPSQGNLRIRALQADFHRKGSVCPCHQFPFGQQLLFRIHTPEPSFRASQSITYLTALYRRTRELLRHSLQRQRVSHGIGLLHLLPSHLKRRTFVLFHPNSTRSLVRFNAERSGQCFRRQLELCGECAKIVGRQLLSGDFLIVGIPQSQPHSCLLTYLHLIPILHIGHSRYVHRLSFTIECTVCKQIHPVDSLLRAAYGRQDSSGPIGYLHKIIFRSPCMHPQLCIHIWNHYLPLLVCTIRLIYRIITWYRN